MVLIDEPDELGATTPLHLNDLAQSELVLMVKNLQLETSKLRAELRTLSSVRTVSAPTDQPVDPLIEHRAAFLELGKRFSILSELWADENALGRPYPATVQYGGPWSIDRRDGTASKQDKVTAEIYACVPQEFHKLIHISPLFSSTFLEGMGDNRGYMIDTVRKHAIVIFNITGLSGSEFTTSYDRSTVPQFTELLQSPNAPEDKFATYPRILYEDYDTKKLLFGSQVIVNILRAIFLGPTSVGKTGRARRSGPRPLATRLELKSITPGAISAAAIIARFLLSPDPLFTEEGGKTSIKYREDFERYKAFLIKYSEADAIKSLVNKINADVLQINSEGTGDRVSAPIPHVDEEDLVAQALFNVQGPEDEPSPPTSPPNTVQPDSDSPVPITSNAVQTDSNPPVPITSNAVQPDSNSPVSTISSTSRLRIVPHTSSPAAPTPSPEGPPLLSHLATSHEDTELPDLQDARSRRRPKPKPKNPTGGRTTRSGTKGN